MNQVTAPTLIQKRPRVELLLKAPNGGGYASRPAYETIIQTKEAGFKMASNKMVGDALMQYDQPTGQYWIGTMTAYVSPGRTFREESERIQSLDGGHYIVYADKMQKKWLFPVPDEYLDKKDAILVAEPADYTVKADREDRIVRATSVDIVERFPAESDKYTTYLGDPIHDLPCGDKLRELKPDLPRIIVSLRRIDKRVGLAVSDYYTFARGIGATNPPPPPFAVGIIKRTVNLYMEMSDRYPVAIVREETETYVHQGDAYRGAWVPETSRAPEEEPEGVRTKQGILKRLAHLFCK